PARKAPGLRTGRRSTRPGSRGRQAEGGQGEGRAGKRSLGARRDRSRRGAGPGKLVDARLPDPAGGYCGRIGRDDLRSAPDPARAESDLRARIWRHRQAARLGRDLEDRIKTRRGWELPPSEPPHKDSIAPAKPTLEREETIVVGRPPGFLRLISSP